MPRRYPSLRTLRAIYISPEHGAVSRGDECCICLDRYDNGTHRPVGVTSNRECEHVFGRRCLEAYLDSTNPGKNTCPVCRRKWYSRRATNPSTPRDTNTSQVLSPPTQPGTSVRHGAESRALHRPPPRVDARVDRAVEQLVDSMETLEALERRGTIRLEQDIRVRLQQVQGHIHAFLERNVATSEVFSGPALHHRSRIVPYSVREGSTNHRPDPIVAELDNSQHPYSLSSVAFQSSTVSLPDLSLPGQRSSQQIDSPLALTTPVPDYRPDSAAAERRPIQYGYATASPLLVTGLQTEAPSHLDGQRNVALPQPSSQSVLHEAIDTRATRDHLRAHRHDRSRTRSTQEAGVRSLSHTSLPDIAEVEGHTPPPTSATTAATIVRPAATQATNEGHTHQHTQPPTQRQGHATEHAPILFPRFQSSRLSRMRSTHGSAHDSQRASTPPQPILAASMAERGTGLRSRATVTRSPRGLSRIMSISNLRDLVAGNRAR